MAEASRKKILIVEDEPFLRKIMVETFQQAGFEVLEAADGEAGLNLALAQQPDVTLLDILMPKMDGITVLRRMRQNPWGKHALIIMLTNLTADNQVLEGMSDNPPSYYFVKSDMELEELVAKVNEIINQATHS